MYQHIVDYYANQLMTADANDWPHTRLRVALFNYLRLQRKAGSSND